MSRLLSTSGLRRGVLGPLIIFMMVFSLFTALTPLGRAAAPFDHVVTILMENHNIGSITPTAAPYMTSLASSWGLATHYTGITHPSEPNYMALISASTQGLTSDGNCCYQKTAPQIIDRIEAAGLIWQAWAEDATNSGTCSFTPPRNADHFPFKEFSDMNTAARCSHFTTTTSPTDNQFIASLTATAPNYIWLTPNDCDNMHSCSVTTGDNYLKGIVPRILNSTLFQTTRAVLFITFDEGSLTYPTDYVWTIWAGKNVAKTGFTSATQYSHYAYLKTIENAWGVSTLTSNDAGAPAMMEFFGSSPPSLTVSFTFSPSPATIGQTITFTGNATGGVSPYTYSWDFGDSSTGLGNPATHAYTVNGSYTVKLTVKDSASPTASQVIVSNTVVVGTPSLTFVKNPTNSLLLGHTEPEAIKVGNVYYLYYRFDSASHESINVMSTTDGVTFTELGTVLTNSSSGWDSVEVISPSILLDGGTYYLYYEGAGPSGRAIGVATSSSPTGPFTKYSGNPVLIPSAAWETNIVGTPAIAKIGTGYFLFYHGYDGRDQGGVAYSSKPLGPWTKEPNNPILPVGPAGSWDQAKTAPSSTLVVSSSKVWIFYEGFDGTSWRSGLATGSVDPLDGRIKTLTKAPKPIIDLGPLGSFDSVDAQLPGAVYTGTEIWVYYSGNDGLAYRLGRAIAQYTLSPSLTLTVPSSLNVNEGSLLTFTVSGTDSVSSAAVTLNASIIPTGATFPSVSGTGSATGTFSWTPGTGQAGIYTIIFSATDNNSPQLSSSKSVTITVLPLGSSPPVLGTIGTKIVNELTLLAFTATATDVDGDTLTFSLGAGAPTGAGITSSGVFTWTPTEAQGPGVYSVTVTVTDSGSPPASGSATFTITVNEVNLPPNLTVPGSQTVDEGSILKFTIIASDPDIPVETITYSASGLPSGASFSSSSLAFSWTPSEGQGPGDYMITFKATDNGVPALSSTKTVAIHVNDVNLPPVLTVPGPLTANTGSSITFTVIATDPDIPVNSVTLSAIGVPAGASFNPTTGMFSWSPSSSQAGMYTVTFTATDNGTPPLSDTKTVALQVQGTGGSGGGQCLTCWIPVRLSTVWLLAIGGTLGLMLSVLGLTLRERARLQRARKRFTYT